MIIRVSTSIETYDIAVEDDVVAKFMFESMVKNIKDAEEMFFGSLYSVELLNNVEFVENVHFYKRED